MAFRGFVSKAVYSTVFTPCPENVEMMKSRLVFIKYDVLADSVDVPPTGPESGTVVPQELVLGR